MFDEEKARQELNERQLLRAGAGLPLLDIERELRIMREQNSTYDEAMTYSNWKADNPKLVQTINEEVLADLRKKWNKAPDWVPSPNVGGGGMWYNLEVRERLHQVFKMR